VRYDYEADRCFPRSQAGNAARISCHPPTGRIRRHPGVEHSAATLPDFLHREAL
jgi:hypothetical protein